jgi:hypothetical protein
MRSVGTYVSEEPPSAVLSGVRTVFRAVVTTIVPEAKQLDEGSWSDLEGLVERALRDRPAALLRQVRFFLRAIQWVPVSRYGHTFNSLSGVQRQRFLSYLQDHWVERIRCGFWGLRTLIFLGYYGRPEAAKAIGYGAHPRGWGA